MPHSSSRKILVLGYGNTGSVIIRDLIETSGAYITIAGRRLEKVKHIAEEIGSERINVEQVDVTEHDRLVQVLKNTDIIINSTWYRHNVSVMKAAIETCVDYIDLGGLYHVTLKQLELDDLAKEAGVTAIPGCGCAPGITNVLAKYGGDKLDEVDSVYMYSGTVMFEKVEGVKIAYAASTLLDELTLNPVIYKNGEYVEVSPFSGEETIRFPEPIGDVKAYIVIHSEHATIPRTINKGIKNAIFRIITSPATVSRLKALDEIGLTSKEPISVKGISISPRDFLETYFSSLTSAEVKREAEIHVLRVDIRGTKDCKKAQFVYDVFNEAKPEWHANSSAFATGVAASIAAQMLARGDIRVKGVVPPEVCIEPEPFIAELQKRNMKIICTESRER